MFGKTIMMSALLSVCAALPLSASDYFSHPDAWPDTPGSAPAPVPSPSQGQPTPYPGYTLPGHYGSDTLPEFVPGTVHSVNRAFYGAPSAPKMAAKPLPSVALDKAVIIYFKATVVQSFIECTVTSGNIASFLKNAASSASGEFAVLPRRDGSFLVSDSALSAEQLALKLRRGKWGNWLLSTCPFSLSEGAQKIKIVFRNHYYVHYEEGITVEGSVSNDNRSGVFSRFHLGLVSVKAGVYTVVPLKGQEIKSLLRRLSKAASVGSVGL